MHNNVIYWKSLSTIIYSKLWIKHFGELTSQGVEPVHDLNVCELVPRRTVRLPCGLP